MFLKVFESNLSTSNLKRVRPPCWLGGRMSNDCLICTNRVGVVESSMTCKAIATLNINVSEPFIYEGLILENCDKWESLVVSEKADVRRRCNSPVIMKIGDGWDLKDVCNIYLMAPGPELVQHSLLCKNHCTKVL